MDDQSVALLEARTRRLAENIKRRRSRALNKDFQQIYNILSLVYDIDAGTVVSGSVPPLEGDVDGSIADNTVRAIQGRDVSGVAPDDGDVYIWDDAGQEWVAGPQTGGGGGSGGHTITEEGGASLAQRSILNFIGSLVTAADDAANGRTNITITNPVPAHEGAADPHAQYTTDAEVASALATALAAYIARSLIDAKGDLLVGTANDTVARLAVGTNGTVPIADSTQATGIRWDTPSTVAPTTMWVPVSNGDPDFPEILFDDDGTVLMEEVTL
jgi:hypothetical protein